MKVFIWDTETTGLPANRTVELDKQPDIIEFFGWMVDLKTGKTGKPLELLIKPREFPMTPELMKKCKTKLDNEILADAPLFPEVAKKIKKTLEAAPFIITHNLSFDKEMVDIEFERMKEVISWPKGLCTVEQTCHLKGYRLSMDKLYAHLFKSTFEDAHRAGADVKALTRICVELFKRGLL